MLKRRLPLFLVSLSTAKVDSFPVGNCKKMPPKIGTSILGGMFILSDLPKN